jgi:hypothetical protein
MFCPSSTSYEIASEFQLTELYAELDDHLRRGVIASSIPHPRLLPDEIANKVTQSYKDSGWSTSFSTCDGRTIFVFTR